PQVHLTIRATQQPHAFFPKPEPTRHNDSRSNSKSESTTQAVTSQARTEKNRKDIAVNRQAFHNYEIIEKFEAGLVLTGTEIKSARDGRVNLKDAYGIVKAGEIWLLNCHIDPYSHGNYANHEPLRTRKLLLKRSEINRLIG